MKKGKDKKIDGTVNFLFEAGMLARTPRTGFFFLGSGEQSVAEHINRVCYIGYVLGIKAKNTDISKILEMCLFHDFAEARVSDLNYVHQKYTKRDEGAAIKDLIETLPFGKKIEKTIDEYELRESYEAKIVKDADYLELILSLKEQIDIGNKKAESWIAPCVQRLKTQEAKELVKSILNTNSDDWWYGNKNDKWWVDRNKK